MDFKNATVIVNVDTQSSEIYNCVIKNDKVEDIGAGD
jgi:S-adenosylmethionine synthetase